MMMMIIIIIIIIVINVLIYSQLLFCHTISLSKVLVILSISPPAPIPTISPQIQSPSQRYYCSFGPHRVCGISCQANFIQKNCFQRLEVISQDLSLPFTSSLTRLTHIFVWKRHVPISIQPHQLQNDQICLPQSDIITSSTYMICILCGSQVFELILPIPVLPQPSPG